MRKRIFLSTIDERAHIIARADGLGLELAEYCTAMNMDLLFDKTNRAVCEKMKGLSRFTLHGPFSELFPCAIDLKIRAVAAERYIQTLTLAQSYGVSKVILHGGYNPRIYFPCWYTEQSIIFWKEFVDKIPKGTTVCLENVFEEEPEMLYDIISGVNDERIKMCLDIGHVNAYSKASAKHWLNVCGKHISHFHLHNNDGTRDAHAPLAEGTIQMREFMLDAQAYAPNADFTLELPEAELSVEWLRQVGILEPD